MEIRGTAWTTGDLEPVLTIEYVRSEFLTDPIGAIERAKERLIERLTTGRAVQRSLITYSMGSGEFDIIVKAAKEQAMKEGREEAWDLARRIVADGSSCYAYDEVYDVFGTRSFWQILGMPVEEALAKDKEHQEEKKTLHIGDEVEFIGSNPKYKVKVNELMTGYVIGFEDSLSGEPFVRILTKKHGTYRRSLEMCEKTGKHNPDIEKVMASFEKGEEDGDI